MTILAWSAQAHIHKFITTLKITYTIKQVVDENLHAYGDELLLAGTRIDNAHLVLVSTFLTFAITCSLFARLPVCHAHTHDINFRSVFSPFNVCRTITYMHSYIRTQSKTHKQSALKASDSCSLQLTRETSNVK